MSAQQKDAAYAQIAAELAEDASAPAELRALADDPRVTVRRGGAPARGKCVVYWMQRAQRGRDNHALDKAVDVANALGLPCVAYFAGIRNFPNANLRHYAFLNQGLAEIEEDCAERGVGFVMRRAPDEDHMKFFADVEAAMVVGDENPMRVPEQWRVKIANALGREKIPFWTVDADVVVPSKLLEKAQFRRAWRGRGCTARCRSSCVHIRIPSAVKAWKQPRGLLADDVRADITRGWRDFDRSVQPVPAWQGGHRAAMQRLQHFCGTLLASYDRDRNHPETDGSSKLSPWLHFGHMVR